MLKRGNCTQRKAPMSLSEYKARLDRCEATLARISAWTYIYGEALKPTPDRSDTFGDGMWEAKNQVSRLLAGAR